MSALTDTDLTVLEGLDFAPPCDPPNRFDDCDHDAEWAITRLSITCGCVVTRLMCTPHKTDYLEENLSWTWICAGCQQEVGFGPVGEFFRILDVEAL